MQFLPESTQPDRVVEVAIVTSAVDGVTSNPLTWNALWTEFPGLHFSLHTFVPQNDNHIYIPLPSGGYSFRWSVYDVDLLAQLYQPMPHELTDVVEPATFSMGTWDADTVAVHRQFLVLRLASLRWRVAEGPVDI